MLFIRTSDQDTANKLISSGFKLIQQNGQLYTFENSPNKCFSDDIDETKIARSNKLII